jgi:hypothetical protein
MGRPLPRSDTFEFGFHNEENDRRDAHVDLMATSVRGADRAPDRALLGHRHDRVGVAVNQRQRDDQP